MTFLDCSVIGCIYNADECCCKGDITVAGKEAERKAHTCCASFVERRAEGSSNAAKRISKVVDVACEACNCVFNKEKKCSAEHIGIVGGDACEYTETECASFRCGK